MALLVVKVFFFPLLGIIPLMKKTLSVFAYRFAIGLI